MPWAELARRFDTHPYTMRCWKTKGVRPSARHMMAQHPGGTACPVSSAPAGRQACFPIREHLCLTDVSQRLTETVSGLLRDLTVLGPQKLCFNRRFQEQT